MIVLRVLRWLLATLGLGLVSELFEAFVDVFRGLVERAGIALSLNEPQEKPLT